MTVPEPPGGQEVPPGAADDRRLLAAHLAGDREAFATLVHRHRDRLWGVALRTMGDREEAADALQDALISAFRNAASYRGDAAVTTWLHRIVVNACIDRTRRRLARPSVPLEDREVPQRRDDHAVTDARLDVRAALARLPEAQRIAIVLVDMEDLPVAEVATLLGVAEGTVKSRCARGRMTLAAMLRDAGGDRSTGSASGSTKGSASGSASAASGSASAASGPAGVSGATARRGNPAGPARVEPEQPTVKLTTERPASEQERR